MISKAIITHVGLSIPPLKTIIQFSLFRQIIVLFLSLFNLVMLKERMRFPLYIIDLDLFCCKKVRGEQIQSIRLEINNNKNKIIVDT